jgi:tetratricopeptide (TPR) repeat protein
MLISLKSLFTLIRFGRAVVDESEDGKDQDSVNMDDLFSANEEPRAEADPKVIEDKAKEQDDIDRQNDDETTIKLRHASLGDYLRSNDIKRTRLTARLSEGELELASLCMQIVCDPNKDLSELWEYAAASWLQHLRKVDDSSLSRTDVFQVALRIAQVLTSPESARQLIHYGDFDNFDWEYTDSAAGAKNREVVLKWLIKAHSLGLTTDKKIDLPNLINTTGPDLRDLNPRATNEAGDTVDILNEPKSSSPAETTTATTTMLGSAFGSSAEVPTALNHVLTAQLEGMMTRSVAAAVQQILKRLKNAGTGQFIFEESMFSGSGDDLELPMASIDRGGSTQNHFNIGTDATLSYLELGPILAEHRRKELISKYSFLTKRNDTGTDLFFSTAWIDQVVANPSQILVCFTKMILTTWYQEDFHIDNIWDVFLMAWTCFRSVSTASQSSLQMLTTYQTDRMATLNLAAPIRKAPWRHTQRKMQCLVEAFPELETDSEVHIISFDAHLAIGSFLLRGKYRKEALTEFNKSLTIAGTDLQRCKARRRIAEIHLLQKNHEAGCELLEAILKSDLGADENALNFIKEVHACLGEMYRDKGEHARALEAYEAACTFPTAKENPDEFNPQYFEEIVECLYHLDRHEAILDKFAKWDDHARDQWLLRALAKTQTVLHIAVKMTDRPQLIVDYYTGAAKRSNSREIEYIYWFKLADAYWHVLDEPKKALEINQRVFRNATRKLRSTDPSELYMWRDARSQFTLLLWETALNPEACDKEQISQYLSEILVEFALKPADRDDYWSQNDDRVQSLLCARIYKILGQTVEAKKILDQEFNLCVEMLEDNVGSNDIYAFDGLTQVLAVAGCQEEAILSYSLLFSNVNPQTASPEEKEADDDSDCDSDDDERDDEPPLDNLSRSKSNPLDEDLYKVSYGCDSCNKRIRNFSEPVYTCLICPNIDLCEPCYKKLMEDKSGLRGFVGRWRYCNLEKHEYLRGPVDGWRGVKDGVIRYGGKEVKFTEWLAGLKEMWEALAL